MKLKKIPWFSCMLIIATVSGCNLPQETPSPQSTSNAPAAISTPTPTPTPVPAVGDHPSDFCTPLSLEIELQQHQSVEDMHNEMHASGNILLEVKPGQPPSVLGEGEIPITGQGTAGDCTFTWGGALYYRFTGEILPTDSGRELHLRGERSGQVVAQGEECMGAGGVPLESFDEFTLPYQDGASVEWEWHIPTIQGQASWTLHLTCTP